MHPLISDDDRRTLANFIHARFGSNYHEAVRVYDGNKDGKLGQEDLPKLLIAAFNTSSRFDLAAALVAENDGQALDADDLEDAIEHGGDHAPEKKVRAVAKTRLTRRR